jgi:peroxiredoxin
VTSILIVSSALLWVVLLFNLLLTLELVHRINRFLPMPNFYNISTLKVGTPAPDFVAETLDSEIVTLSNFADRAVAFVFTSPNCPGCVKRIPELETLGARAHRHRAELVLVSTVGKAETQAMIEEYRIKLPVLVAPRDSNPFAQDYKAVAVPFYCLVDDEGKVQSTGLLDTEWEELTRRWRH